MPKYRYRCQSCNYMFEIVHSIVERLADCNTCEVSGSLQREQFTPTVNINRSVDKPDGSTVRERVEGFIEQSRDDLREQKREVERELYKEDKK